MSPEQTRQAAIEARRRELLTVKEYAYVIRRHEEHIRQRCRKGTQPGAVKIGGAWYVDLSVVVPPPCSF